MRKILATIALLATVAAVVPIDADAAMSGGMGRSRGHHGGSWRPASGQNPNWHRSGSSWSGSCAWSNCSRWRSSQPFFFWPWAYAPFYSSPFFYGPPGYAAGPGYDTAPPPSPMEPPASYGGQQGLSLDRDVVFPEGRYILQGDGVNVPYRWVWIPNPPTAPPPPDPR